MTKKGAADDTPTTLAEVEELLGELELEQADPLDPEIESLLNELAGDSTDLPAPGTVVEEVDEAVGTAPQAVSDPDTIPAISNAAAIKALDALRRAISCGCTVSDAVAGLDRVKALLTTEGGTP